MDYDVIINDSSVCSDVSCGPKKQRILQSKQPPRLQSSRPIGSLPVSNAASGHPRPPFRKTHSSPVPVLYKNDSIPHFRSHSLHPARLNQTGNGQPPPILPRSDSFDRINRHVTSNPLTGSNCNQTGSASRVVNRPVRSIGVVNLPPASVQRNIAARWARINNSSSSQQKHSVLPKYQCFL